MTYLIVLGVAFLAVVIATPLTVLALRFLDKSSHTPIPEVAPAPESLSDLERVERIARGGRRVPRM